ncbi:MAG: CBS domain-containing protein [Burkholderiales bacterium]|nr:CBS domain-containing protein [Burkholderiales bacterium]
MSVRSVMRKQRLLKVPPEATIGSLAEMMARKNVGAGLVVEDDRLIGIVSERDVVFRVIAHGLDPRATRAIDVMTSAPHTIEPDKRFGYALLIMFEKGFRHLPVVEKGKLIGIVSARSALDPDLEEFRFEEERRKHLSKIG